MQISPCRPFCIFTCYCEFQSPGFHSQETKQEFQPGIMETPERLENCPPTPEEIIEGSSGYLEEARVSKLKLLENNICVICYSSIKEEKKCFPECCLHIFCFECLCKWSKHKNQCPLCKKGEFAGRFLPSPHRSSREILRNFCNRIKNQYGNQNLILFLFRTFFPSFRHNHPQCEIKD